MNQTPPGGPLSFVGVLYTTPRVGQNAVLRALRTHIPGADEWGAARPINGLLVMAINRPPPSNAWDHFDTTHTRWGSPVWLSRRDKVDQAISWALAAQTGQFRSDVAKRGDAEYRREDVEKALATINDQERRWVDHLYGTDVLHLWYEDHVEQDPRIAAEMILNWWDFADPANVAEPDIHRIDGDEKRRWRALWAQGR